MQDKTLHLSNGTMQTDTAKTFYCVNCKPNIHRFPINCETVTMQNQIQSTTWQKHLWVVTILYSVLCNHVSLKINQVENLQNHSWKLQQCTHT